MPRQSTGVGRQKSFGHLCVLTSTTRGSECAFIVVSENKVLCHPSSVDSLTTSAGTEDHVSMGGWAARKALQVVTNVEHGLLHPGLGTN